MTGLLLALVLAATAPGAPGKPAAPPRATPRPTPSRPEPVVAGAGVQLHPTACRLSTGVQLLAFERLQTASARRAYLKRRRPGFGWSFGREVTLPRGGYTVQAPSLLCRGGDEVLLYAQVGDLRRRTARVRLYRGKGDSLVLDPGRDLGLGLPARAALTDPFAAHAADGRGVLLTVTRRFAGAEDGCLLARSPDGQRVGTPARRLGPGERCRTVALGPARLLLTYQHRTSRRQPLRAWFRVSTDDGVTWSAPAPVARLRESFDAYPVARPGGGAAIYHVARLAGKAALFVTRLGPQGQLQGNGRLTPFGRARVLTPCLLAAGTDAWLFFAREVRPLDFDILGGVLRSR